MRCPVVVMALIALPLPALAQANPALIAYGRALFNAPRLSGDRPSIPALPAIRTATPTTRPMSACRSWPPATPRAARRPACGERAAARAGWSWAGNVPTLETSIRDMIVNRMKGAEPTKQTIDALAAYTRSLPNGPAPLLNDGSIQNDTAPPAVKRGYALFAGKAGCVNCHRAPVIRQQGARGRRKQQHFKAPSLRSVSKTAPYFHDSHKTLDEAVNHGAVTLMTDAYRRKAGVSDTLTDAEKRDIVAFLKAL